VYRAIPDTGRTITTTMNNVMATGITMRITIDGCFHFSNEKSPVSFYIIILNREIGKHRSKKEEY